jgi:hypothetical protein
MAQKEQIDGLKTMANKEKRSRSKKRPRKYQKKLTLYGMEFEKVVDAVLKYKPKK